MTDLVPRMPSDPADKKEAQAFVNYLTREGVKPNTTFWWEKLPILKHLATKRLAAKLTDQRLVWIIARLGYDPTPKFTDRGELYLEEFPKPKLKRRV